LNKVGCIHEHQHRLTCLCTRYFRLQNFF
jgi:hypothetical protein